MSQERQRVSELLVNLVEGQQITLDGGLVRKMAEAYLAFDRHELIKTYRALRKETEQLELAEKIAGIGHWYWQVGNQEVIWSEQIYRIHGVEHGTFKPTLDRIIEAYHPDDRKTVENHLADAMEMKTGFQFELRLVRPDGAVRDVFSKGEVEQNQNGEVVAIFGIFQDITERKRNERLQKSMRNMLEKEVKRRTRELRMANQELKDYAYIVSHDLRSPLINIMGFSKDLENSVEEISGIIKKSEIQLPTRQKDFLDGLVEQDIPESVKYIRCAAEKMDKLISSLLELSRLGSRIPRIQEIDLTHLTQRIVESLRYQLESRNAQVCLGPLPVIEADEAYLNIIMNNLLSNAVKYLNPEIPGKIEVDCAVDENMITIAVKDNGIGIEHRDLKKIFQPFRRVGSTGVEGEGMGLAYVQMAVRQCSGEIQVVSRPDIGSTFQFTIPVKHLHQDG